MAVSMTRELNVIIERDEEGYYVASVPELRGCHTQARTLGTVMKRIREAIDLTVTHKSCSFSQGNRMTAARRLRITTRGAPNDKQDAGMPRTPDSVGQRTDVLWTPFCFGVRGFPASCSSLAALRSVILSHVSWRYPVTWLKRKTCGQGLAY